MNHFIHRDALVFIIAAALIHCRPIVSEVRETSQNLRPNSRPSLSASPSRTPSHSTHGSPSSIPELTIFTHTSRGTFRSPDGLERPFDKIIPTDRPIVFVGLAGYCRGCMTRTDLSAFYKRVVDDLRLPTCTILATDDPPPAKATLASLGVRGPVFVEWAGVCTCNHNCSNVVIVSNPRSGASIYRGTPDSTAVEIALRRSAALIPDRTH